MDENEKIKIGKRAVWFGWFFQEMVPPREPPFLRERRERAEARKSAANGKSRAAKSRSHA